MPQNGVDKRLETAISVNNVLMLIKNNNSAIIVIKSMIIILLILMVKNGLDVKIVIDG